MSQSIFEIYNKPEELEKYISNLHGGIPVVCFPSDADFLPFPPEDFNLGQNWIESQIRNRAVALYDYLLSHDQAFARISFKCLFELASSIGGKVFCDADMNTPHQVMSEAEVYSSIEKGTEKYSIVVVMPASNVTAQGLFGGMSGMSHKYVIEKWPKSLVSLLALIMSHEIEHTRQAVGTYLFSTEELADTWGFVKECGADSAACDEIGQRFPEAAHSYVLARAMRGILSANGRIRTSLVVDALSRGASVPDYNQVMMAHRELRLRLFGEETGMSLISFDSEVVQQAIERIITCGATSDKTPSRVAFLLDRYFEQEMKIEPLDHGLKKDNLKLYPELTFSLLHQLDGRTVTEPHTARLLALVKEWIINFCPSAAKENRPNPGIIYHPTLFQTCKYS